MYQWPKCSYSYFSEAVEFNFRVFFFPVIILNAGLSEKFFIVDHPKKEHNEKEFKG